MLIGVAIKEIHMAVLQKVKLEPLYDSVIPFLGFYPKEMKSLSQKYISTPCSLQYYLQQPRYGKVPFGQ